MREIYGIAVCDDDKGFLDEIACQIEEAARQLGEELSVRRYESAEELIASEEPFDVLFLDIQMGGISGMQAAHVLRGRGRDFCLIFLTSMVQYAIDGYDVHAFAFLPKPVKPGVLMGKLAEALEYVRALRGSILALQTGEGIVSVSSRDIIYADVLDHTTRVVTRNGTVSCSLPLEKLIRQLPDGEFFRCHKSYTVNFSAVRVLGKTELIMENGDSVPISKHRRAEMLSAFARFSGGIAR